MQHEIFSADVIDHTKNRSEHMTILHDVFKQVKQANLSLRLSKCKTGYRKVDFIAPRCT